MNRSFYAFASVVVAGLLFSAPSFAQSSASAPAAPKKMDCANCEAPSAKTAATKRDACAVPMTLALSGMHCDGCAANVSKSLMAVTGVEEVKVNSKTQQAVVWVCPHKNVKPEALTAAVTKAGYKVTKVSKGDLSKGTAKKS